MFWLSARQKEEYALEAMKVAEDSMKVMEEFQRQPTIKKRLELLSSSYHPVARLVVSDMFAQVTTDFIDKERLAAEGDRDAAREVDDVRMKINNVLEEERQHLESSRQPSNPKWQDLQQEVESDIRIALTRLEAIVPKNRNDVSQWKNYYLERLKVLTNKALTPVGRLMFVSAERDQLIGKFRSVVSQLVDGADVEEELHKLEVDIQLAVDAEIERLKKDYPQFFSVKPHGGQTKLKKFSGQGGI